MTPISGSLSQQDMQSSRRLFPWQHHAGPYVSMGGFPARCPNHLNWLVSMWGVWHRGLPLSPTDDVRGTSGKRWLRSDSCSRLHLKGCSEASLLFCCHSWKVHLDNTALPQHKGCYRVRESNHPAEKLHFNWCIVSFLLCGSCSNTATQQPPFTSWAPREVKCDILTWRNKRRASTENFRLSGL